MPVRIRSRSHSQSRTWFRARLLITGVCAVVLFLLIGLGVIARMLAPRSNTSRTHFDVIVVLGTPTDKDGLPTPRQQGRVREAVHEYQLGVAPMLLFTGGRTRYGFVEADAMGEMARSLGVPQSQILLERQAHSTIQNACYSVAMMQAHNLHSAELIGSPSQMPRAALIFSRFPIEYATDASASTGQPPSFQNRYEILREMLKTSRFLLFGKRDEPCLS